jgi:AcrR family transcriptional regulator
VSRRPSEGPKGQRTRARLLDSAEHVFIQKGYVATRVADIADAADLAHGSFYTYFDSKADVFRQVADRVVQDVYGALDGRVGGDSALQRIQASNRRYFALYERHAEILGLIEQVATFDEDFRVMRLNIRYRFITRIERAVRRIQNQSEGSFKALDPRLVASALGGMVDNFSFAVFVLGEPFERKQALDTLDEIWRRVFGLPTGGSRPGSSDADRSTGGTATSPMTNRTVDPTVLAGAYTSEVTD